MAKLAGTVLVRILTFLIAFALTTTVAAYDWPQLNGDARHSGNNTQETIIAAATASTLHQLFQVSLPSSADGAVVVQQAVPTTGGAIDLVFMTTVDGRLIALNAYTGATIWSVQHGPGSCKINNGSSACYTTSSPVLDPNRQYVYTYGLDGYVHKHRVADGGEIMTGGWPQLVTLKPYDEKGSSSLSVAVTPGGTFLYVANGGYPGDAGDYQGHVTAINLVTGQQHVFNALCSNLAVHFGPAPGTPGTPDCMRDATNPETQSAIWARPGVVYDSDTGKIYMATGNGAFTPGQHHWGDSVFALNPDGTGNGSGDPVDSYTPTNEMQLDLLDNDLGSTAPAILPTPAGCGATHIGVQGGKDGNFRLLNLDNLSGQAGPGHVGGELGPLFTVGGMLATPAVWVRPMDNSTWVFAGTSTAMSGLRLSCAGGTVTLTSMWSNAGLVYGSSPLIANGVLYYIVGSSSATLYAADPVTGATLWSSPLGPIHWESPVVANGVLYIENAGSQLTAFVPTLMPPMPRSPGSGTPPTGPLPPPRPAATIPSVPAPVPPRR